MSLGIKCLIALMVTIGVFYYWYVVKGGGDDE